MGSFRMEYVFQSIFMESIMEDWCKGWYLYRYRENIIEAAKKALYTGHIGDGKIFVYNVDKVIKIRTGEENP